MALVPITVQGTFSSPLVGSVAEGSVILQLTEPIVDPVGNVILPDHVVTIDLDGTGSIPDGVQVYANDSPDALPTGVLYTETRVFHGAPRFTRTISVPYNAAGGVINLADMVPVEGDPVTVWTPVSFPTLTDVAASSPVDGDAWVYDEGTDTWGPAAVAGGGGDHPDTDHATLATAAALTAEESARAAADDALDGRLDTIEALGPLATAASVTTEASTRAAADTALDGRLDVIEAVGTLASAASVVTEASTRAAADSALDSRLDVLEGSVTFPLASTRYYGPRGQTVTGIAFVNANGVRGGPIVVERETTFDRIGVFVNVAAAANGVFRVGVYPTVDGIPSGTSPLAESVLDVTVTGLVVATISLTLPPGVYVPAGIVQGSPATGPTIRGVSDATTIRHMPFDPAGGGYAGWSLSPAVAAALPASSASPTQVTNVPLVVLRKA